MATQRRCAVWMTSETLAKSEELANLLGVDVDTFIDLAVTSLHEHEAAEGQLRARAEAVARGRATGANHVVALQDRRKRGRRNEAQ